MRSWRWAAASGIACAVIGQTLECASLDGLSGGRAEADGSTAPDAADAAPTPTDAADSADTRPFSCATQSPPTTFCADFDEGSLLAGWDKFATDGVVVLDGGLDDAVFRSPPSSYGGVIPAIASRSYGSGWLQKRFATTAIHLALAFDVLVDVVPDDGGDLFVAALSLGDASYVLELAIGPTGSFLKEQLSTEASSISHQISGAPTVHRWTHVVVGLDFLGGDAPIVASSATVTWDGTIGAQGLPLVAHMYLAPPTLRVGPIYVDRFPGGALHIDNVTFDMKP